jgi:hypothetical protein
VKFEVLSSNPKIFKPHFTDNQYYNYLKICTICVLFVFSNSKYFNKIVLSGLKKMLGYFYTGLHPVLLYLAKGGMSTPFID